MIEIELFYKIVESKIRKNHAEYLEGQKREIVPVELPQVDDLPQGEAWKKLGFFARIKCLIVRRKQIKAYNKAVKKRREVRVADKLLKGYNAGVKSALCILKREFKAFNRRMENEEN